MSNLEHLVSPDPMLKPNSNEGLYHFDAQYYVNDYFYRNIPEDQRVIDPKRGPIRKTAAVKTLPRIDGNETARF